MYLLILLVLFAFGIVVGYWYFFSNYTPPHFKGRHKFSDLDDAIGCLWKFGYHGASLEIKQIAIKRFFAIVKYIDHEYYGLELPIPLDYWTDEELYEMRNFCDLNKIDIIENIVEISEEKVWYFDCKSNLDMAINLSKFLCVNMLKMNGDDFFDYNFDALSVYDEFPRIDDHPSGWSFQRH